MQLRRTPPAAAAAQDAAGKAGWSQQQLEKSTKRELWRLQKRAPASGLVRTDLGVSGGKGRLVIRALQRVLGDVSWPVRAKNFRFEK